MRSREDVFKIKAAALYLLNRLGGVMDYVKLYKLLYFAQQRSLATYGREIFDDTFSARDRGPVPGFLNASVKQLVSRLDGEPLLDIVANALEKGEGFQIRATEKADLDDLSGSDIECLEYSINDYGNLSLTQLIEATHRDSAWIAADRRRRLDPDQSRISRLEMADAAGISPAMRDYLKSQLELDTILGR